MSTSDLNNIFGQVGDGSGLSHQDMIYPEELALAFRNRGMLLEALAYDITPTGMHYLLTHFDVPNINAETWSLSLKGLFKNPTTLQLSDLLNRPKVTMPVTLECAGNGRAKLHHRLTGRLLRDDRRFIRLERHETPPRAPPVALFIRDVFLLGIARLGVHLDGPHVGVVIGIDLRRAVVAPAVAAVSAQLHVRGDAALEQRRLSYFAKWIGRLPVGIISACVGVLGETGVADQHITLFIHR